MRFYFIFALNTTCLHLASCGHTSDVSDPALATRRTHESKNHIGFWQAHSHTVDAVSHEENTERFADSVRTSITKLVDGFRRIVDRRRRTTIKLYEEASSPLAVVKMSDDARVAPVEAVDYVNSPPVLSGIEELTIPAGLEDDLELIVLHPDSRMQVLDDLDDTIEAKAQQLVLSLPLHDVPDRTVDQYLKIYFHLLPLLGADKLAVMLSYAKLSRDTNAMFNAGSIQEMQFAHWWHYKINPLDYKSYIVKKFGDTVFVKDSYTSYQTLYNEWNYYEVFKSSIPSVHHFPNNENIVAP